MIYEDKPRTLPQLIADLVNQFTELFQTELRLVKAEFSEKLSQYANGGTMIGAGGVALLVALFLVLQAIVLWLAALGLPERWGYLLVGLVVGGIGAGVLMKGINNLKTTNLVPDRTLGQVRADVATVKERVS